jgi:hypothetical protein
MRTLLSVAAISLLAAGCSSPSQTPAAQTNPDRMQKKAEVLLRMRTQPDVPAWYTQREQVTQAMGDRVFDKDFNRVFSSVPGALLGMGMTVDNMDRESGYIAAHGDLLPPELSSTLRTEARSAWCRANGCDPSLLEKQSDNDIDIEPYLDVFLGKSTPTTLTVMLVRQSEQQTKVKLRFNGVYYPGALEAYYRTVWLAIDKQIFIDKATD